MARSPRRRIRLVTVISGLKVLSDPVGPTRLRQLDTSNGCQDHTVLPSASAPFVHTPVIAHKPKLALQLPRATTLPRPPHPIPTFVTMANAPLPGRDAWDMGVIWVWWKPICFCNRDWTGQIALSSLPKIAQFEPGLIKVRLCAKLVAPTRGKTTCPLEWCERSRSRWLVSASPMEHLPPTVDGRATRQRHFTEQPRRDMNTRSSHPCVRRTGNQKPPGSSQPTAIPMPIRQLLIKPIVFRGGTNRSSTSPGKSPS
jgi:hypothetical protein